MRIDLHLHTSASDGELSPYDLILLCKRIGFDIIAIADHDTMKGFEEIKDIKIGIEIIPAVELSVREENKDIHLLGYYVNNEGSPLFDYLKVFREERIRRIYKIVENLKKMGIKIEAEEIFKESNNAHAIGRPHVARVLVKKGYAENIDDAFEKY
ncbi:MAG: PHP domain-containing protein, partial [candidate division WOR-3 bacterium]